MQQDSITETFNMFYVTHYVNRMSLFFTKEFIRQITNQFVYIVKPKIIQTPDIIFDSGRRTL